jgi:hypothetical protein
LVVPPRSLTVKPVVCVVEGNADAELMDEL